MWFMLLLAILCFAGWWIEKGDDTHDPEKWFRWR